MNMATSMATAPLTSLNVLGLNSGTSMDGIDAGLFKITPVDSKRPADGKCPALKVELISSQLFAFQDDLKIALEALVAGKQTDLRTICLVNSALGHVFGEAASKVVEPSCATARSPGSAGLRNDGARSDRTPRLRPNRTSELVSLD